MAKKIIITYSENPIVGNAFSYEIFISGTKITYDTGVNTLNLKYTNTANVPFSDIKIEFTLQETLNNTVNFLRTYYEFDDITYAQLGNTIEVFINYSGPIDVEVSNVVNEKITISVNTVVLDEINLKYYLQYKNLVNDEYLLGIYAKNYSGTPKEVNGNITIDKGSVKDHLDSIRGTGLSVQLEASKELNFEDLYTENEQDYLVKLYRNEKIFFIGYLKPDGIYQSFVDDIWFINFDCIDGLGALENLSFVKDNGLRFVGKMKALDIVYYCLKRSGINLNINTAINIYYEGLTLTDELDILAKIKLNSDRFFKNDSQSSGDGTIMSCLDVLNSVLDLFTACITQENGEWYIYRPNELYFNNIVNYKRYDLENNFLGNVTKNYAKNIGSQIDNFYPFHCNTNQRIEIQGGVSAYRLGYKYGYIAGLLTNPNLSYDENFIYDGLTIIDQGQLIKNPTKTNGLTIKSISFTPLISSVCVFNPITLIGTEKLSLSMAFETSATVFLRMKIQIGTYYLKYTPANSESSYQEAADKAIWTTNANDEYTLPLIGSGSFDIAIPDFPVSGNLSITIRQTYPIGIITKINKFDVIPAVGTNAEQGEFHTVQRSTAISSLIKENKTVYNGDNAEVVYLGGIFKENGLDTTDLWFRRGYYESKPILKLAAEEELRIAQKPMKVFIGDVYGFIPYLSIININNITGKFLPIEYSYDTITNICKLKNLELFSPEISDLIYTFTFDYGNVVKPTIIG